MDETELKQAQEKWLRGDALEAGRMLFERIVLKERTKWAISILEAVVSRLSAQIDALNELQSICTFPERAVNGKVLFSKIRKQTLAIESKSAISKEEQFIVAVLYLAENVAKVVYNETDPPDEFDEDSGWWIASCARECVKRLENSDFEQLVWQRLSSLQSN